MIRVLHAVSSTATSSGVMSMLMSYHRHLPDGIVFDYLAFTHREQTYDAEIASLNGEVHYHVRPAFTQLFCDKTRSFFNEYCNRHAVDRLILHCHPIYTSFFYSEYAHGSGFQKVIQHSHTSTYSEKRLSNLRNGLLERFAGGRADAYAACSHQAARLFKHVNTDEVFLVNNSIDFDRFTYSQGDARTIRSQWGIPEDAVVLGHIGRFSPQKNHLFLLRVFQRLVTIDARPVVLLLVGDGPMMKEVQESANRLNINAQIVFAGVQKDTAAFLSAMDLFCMPSSREGFGIALIEAQASGLQCLVSDTIPVESDISGRVKRLPLSAGEYAWAEALLEALRNIPGDDPGSYRRQVSLNPGFRIDNCVDKLMSFYGGLIDS